MNVLVSGSSGLLGSKLCPHLEQAGCSVTRLLREKSSDDDGQPHWSPSDGELSASVVDGRDAIIHLGGVNISEHRWNREFMARIRRSRVDSTRLLAETMARSSSPPGVFICASAAGFYGDRDEEELTEDSPAGSGFLAEVCQEWEAAADAAREAGVRVVHLRLGVVLAPDGGALEKMLPVFSKGMGGPIGNGQQFMAWISIDDAVGAIQFALETPEVAGPLNLSAPQPVRNREFGDTLGKVLGKPTLMGMPAFAARLAFGKMADEALLASQRVIPERLKSQGFTFQHPELRSALERYVS